MSLLVAWGDTWTLQRLDWLDSTNQSRSIRAITRRFAVFPSSLKSMEEIGSYSGKVGQGCRRSLTHQHDQYLLRCARRNRVSAARDTKWPQIGHWCECLWPNNQKLTSWCLRDRHPLVDPVLTAQDIGARFAFAIEYQLAALHFSQMSAGSPWASIRDIKGSGEAVENIMLPVT